MISKHTQPLPQIILASTSSARRALLDSLRIPYRAEPPLVDEEVPPGTSVPDAVAMLAKRKAEAVQRRHPDAWIIGCDQLVSLDGEALGKPVDRAAAHAQLRRMAGRSHEIVTGLCLIGSQMSHAHVEVTKMTLFPISEEELGRYLDLDEWKGCAGSYRVEGAGQALFQKIEGDRTNVQGLPITALVHMLRSAGWTFFGDPTRRG